MALFNSFTFDGVNSLENGIYITGAVYNSPERAVEMYPIQGRNGALSLDLGRFENISVVYSCGCFKSEQTAFAGLIRAFRNELSSRRSYCRLTDTYHTDEFRQALFYSGIEVEPFRNRAGEFEITFDCKPQRFLTSGESYTTYGKNSTITNPTKFEARPLIKVTGYGTVNIGSTTITITGTSGVVTYIDCDLMDCYRMSGGAVISANSAVTFSGSDFPTLGATTGVNYSGNVTKVEIMPRWWVV